MAFADAGGDLHAVSIPVPTPRFDQQRAVVTKALLQLRADLPRVLGSYPMAPAFSRSRIGANSAAMSPLGTG